MTKSNIKYLILFTFLSYTSVAMTAEWWDSTRYYRIEVRIKAGEYHFLDKYVTVGIDFSQKLAEIDAAGKMLDPHSIRVLEVDQQGQPLGEQLDQLDIDILIW